MSFDKELDELLDEQLTEKLNNKFNELTKKLKGKGAEILSIKDFSTIAGEKKIIYKYFNVIYQGTEYKDIYIGIDQEGNLHTPIFDDERKKLIDEIIK